MDKTSINIIYLNKIKKYLHKNISKKNIEDFEKEFNEILEDYKIILEKDYENKIELLEKKLQKEKDENIQLRLDNINLHENPQPDEEIFKKMEKIINKLNKDNEELNRTNEELIDYIEKLEINNKNTIGIYTEE